MLPTYTQTKTHTDNGVTVQGNLSAPAFKMAVSEEGAAHIMSLLTDLYSNPNLAVLREYSSNAYDSHKAAGQTRPIEVTLPNNLAPTFVVKDYGVGMSVDDITTIYQTYGASTKRNDFNQVGAFGLGCKSALTLTQSFTLRSVKDGRQTVAIVARGEDGVGTVNVVSQSDTSESNGVTVTIPIPDPNAFNWNVDDTFAAWPKGSVLVDGRAPYSIYDDEDIRQSPSGSFYYNLADRYGEGHGFRVIMGGIAYKVDPYQTTTNYRVQNQLSYGKFWVEIPIGSVDLTPSREAIRYSDRTKTFLAALAEQVTGEVKETIERDIQTAKTRTEALKFHNEYAWAIRTFGVHGLMWNGERIEDHVETEGSLHSYSKSAGRMTSNNYVRHLGLYSSDRVTVVVVEPDGGLHSRLKNNARNAMMQLFPNSWTDRSLFVTNDKKLLENKWVTENESFAFVNTDDLLSAAAAYRKANRKAAPPRTKIADIEYDALVIEKSNGDETILLKSIKQSELPAEVYYIDEDHLRRGSIGLRLAAWRILGISDDAAIVVMPKTRSAEALQKRLGRPMPNVRTLKVDLEKGSDMAEAIAGGNCSMMAGNLKRMARLAESYGDERLDAAIAAASKADELVRDRSKLSVFSMDQTVNIPAIRRGFEELEEIDKRFPLLQLSNSYTYVNALDKHPEHAMLYIKAVINNEREEA